MAKILCGTSGLTGITNASLELLSRLKKEGHDILYISPKIIDTKVAAIGLSYYQLPEILSESRLEIPTYSGMLSKVKRVVYKVMNRKALQASALSEIRPRAFKKIFKQFKPDIVILDVELHEYIIYASTQNTKLVLLSQWFSLWERTGLPYLLHATIPETGFSGSPLGMWLSWRIIRIKRGWTFFKKRLRSLGTDRRSTLMRYAKELGFNRSYIKENNWPGPFVYNTIPVLSMTMEEMEFPHDQQPNLHYVGPMVYASRKDPMSSKSDKIKLEQVQRLQSEEGKQIIYCSVSTLHAGDVSFMHNVVEAVRDHDDWVLVLSMGGNLDVAMFADIPPNVFPMIFVPQLEILAHTACSINHGGIHTINECIHYQVPMLVYSGKRSDQNGCAARVAFHQIGIMADKDMDTTADINANIAEILSNPLYKKNMNRIHKKYLKYKSDRVLETYIDKKLNC